MKVLQKQGRAIYGVDMKIVDSSGAELPWDGKTYGDLLVKGPWIVADYYKSEGGSPLIADAQGRGWFPTGDVATIDADGFMQITDRSKDVIKSGGEWISSIDIENIAMAHPAIAMAACVGMPHPKWDERPIVAVALKPGAEVTARNCWPFTKARPPSGRSLMTWCLSMPFPSGPRARCSRPSCASSSRTTSFPAFDFGRVWRSGERCIRGMPVAWVIAARGNP
jgi:acyl-CoA synthetase (AMP-forming)/AMP-acid ligase II